MTTDFIESKIKNLWYNEECDYLFVLTAHGFRRVKGSKVELLKQIGV